MQAADVFSFIASRQIAAFIVEPIQGKGVILPSEDYLKGAFGIEDLAEHSGDPRGTMGIGKH